MNVSVIIPVFNEVDTILEVVSRVKATNLVHEIIIVDDASRDGTADKLKILKKTCSSNHYPPQESGQRCRCPHGHPARGRECCHHPGC